MSVLLKVVCSGTPADLQLLSASGLEVSRSIWEEEDPIGLALLEKRPEMLRVLL
jgi:hypothetical protein